MLIGSAHGDRANLMPQETIPFDEIVAGASARLAVIDNLQYLSIRDLIMHFSGCSSKTANKVWERMSDSRKEEVSTECRVFQFQGQGQTAQPVISFKGALKLVMWIGGEKAKSYRSAMVNILQRYYAGDGSLVEEVEANAQSAGPVQQMARASLVAEAEQREDALELPFKKRRMELAMAREEAEVKARQIANRVAEREHLSRVVSDYRALCLDKEMDERARLLLKDNVLNMAMIMGGGSGQALLSDGSSRPISLSMVADEMKLQLSSPELISVGQELKRRFVEKHGRPPSKHEQLCGGRVTLVNTYMESDRPLVEEVLRWHAAGRLPAPLAGIH